MSGILYCSIIHYSPLLHVLLKCNSIKQYTQLFAFTMTEGTIGSAFFAGGVNVVFVTIGREACAWVVPFRATNAGGLLMG